MLLSTELYYLSFKCKWNINRSHTKSTKVERFQIQDCDTEVYFLPKALKVAMCSHIFSGWSEWGCQRRASTSCLRQKHGISLGSTTTEKRYWLLPRLIWNKTKKYKTLIKRINSRFCPTHCPSKMISSFMFVTWRNVWIYYVHPTDQQLNTLQVANIFQADTIKFLGILFKETLCPLHKQMGMCSV